MKSEEIYSLVLNNIPVGFSMVDKEGIIVDFNHAAERITGYSKEEVMGKSHIEILHGTSDRDACPLFKYALLRQREAVAAEAAIKRKDGALITLSVTTAPLLDSDGTLTGGVELFRDITEIKRMERERKNILSMFAHDMKNPVTTVGGFLSRLFSGKAGPLTEKQQGYLAIMQDELDKLSALITNFLEFARFEAKEYKPVYGPFHIESDVYKNIEAVRVEADTKKITIQRELPEDLLPVFNADAIMINRVIRNLLGNAIKYTKPRGTITVRLSKQDNAILVQISDTGIGISEEHIPYIFDAFYRVSRDSTGSGLGLAISKAIIEAHGGRIWAESVYGQGSTFSFTLPVS
ncbi:MAG: PAS domain S-box protein [Nitrospiraceae bacterium]|jgi:two-component system, OmpR family, phosphate regulon sensor histidine kinase PhoR|nr:MAG: PAS domain S-box protein [Nitrospiraceae bacterium]